LKIASNFAKILNLSWPTLGQILFKKVDGMAKKILMSLKENLKAVEIAPNHCMLWRAN
jgi:hypothetical protein